MEETPEEIYFTKQILTYMLHLHIKPTLFNDIVLSINQFNKQVYRLARKLII